MDQYDLFAYYFDPLKPAEIDHQEKRLNDLYAEFSLDRPTKPVITAMLVNGTKTLVVYWQSSTDDNWYFYPISEPDIPEFEYVNPNRETEAVFLGPLKELRASRLAESFGSLPSADDDTTITILAFSRRLWGFGKRDLNLMLLPCETVLRTGAGRILWPKTYCNDDWRPVRDNAPPFPTLCSLVVPEQEF
ncbi:hypothetical protein HGA64_04280 [Candidatus Falkowbacteria bacterium]|nr:hypothetical protein [Candidatus Falkowbacteria bacterium]